MQSRISIVKVHWNSRQEPEFTKVRRRSVQDKYPLLAPPPRFFCSRSVELWGQVPIGGSLREFVNSGNGYPEKDEKQSQKRQNWARNGIV
ncbi:hypothetical protein Tco_0734822 [Tanacetum coccineum]